jgi:hypothetical protein
VRRKSIKQHTTRLQEKPPQGGEEKECDAIKEGWSGKIKPCNVVFWLLQANHFGGGDFSAAKDSRAAIGDSESCGTGNVYPG